MGDSGPVTSLTITSQSSCPLVVQLPIICLSNIGNSKEKLDVPDGSLCYQGHYGSETWGVTYLLSSYQNACARTPRVTLFIDSDDWPPPCEIYSCFYDIVTESEHQRTQTCNVDYCGRLFPFLDQMLDIASK